MKIGVSLIMIFLSGCSTANNYKLPPYEVQRVEATCNRNTKKADLPEGTVCRCDYKGNTWFCDVVSEAAMQEALRRTMGR